MIDPEREWALLWERMLWLALVIAVVLAALVVSAELLERAGRVQAELDACRAGGDLGPAGAGRD